MLQLIEELVGVEGIWEIRVQLGSDTFRFLGFFDGGVLLALTDGFAKKTQKTPVQEIVLAVRRKNDYLARK